MRKTKIEEYKSVIMEYYKQGLTALDMSKLIPIHNSTISRFLRKTDLPRPLFSRTPQSALEEIKNYYLEGHSIKDTAIHFNKTEGFINFHLRKMGVTRRRGHTATLNHSYFSEIDSERKAYFLGFLYADGYISKKHSYGLTLSLSAKDSYILQEFKKDIESDREIKIQHRVEKSGREREMATLRLNSPQVYTDLIALGMKERQLINHREVPKIEESLVHHFIRGVFDGDGSVFVTHNKKGEMILGSNFTGEKEFLESLLQTLKQITGSKGKVFDRGNYGSIHFSSNQTLRLYNYFYKDATIYLKRKKEKFTEFLMKGAEGE